MNPLYVELTQYTVLLLIWRSGIAFFVFFSLSVLVAQERDLVLDSLLRFPNDTAQITRLLTYAESDEVDYENTHASQRAALRVAERIGATERVPEIAMLIGDYHLYYVRDADSARLYYNRALSTARSIPLPRKEAQALFELARLAQNEKDYDRAISLGQRVIEVSDSIGATALAAEARMFLGFPLNAGQHYDRALEYFLEALPVFRDQGNDYLIRTAAREAAFVNLKLNKPAEALPLIEEAVSAARRLGIADGIAFTLRGKGEILLILGQYEAAEKAFDEALALRNGASDPNTEKLLAMLYQRTGRKEQARKLIRRAEVSLKGGGEGRNTLRQHEFLSSLYYVAAGNEVMPTRYDSFDHYRALRKLHADSALLLVRKKEMAELDEKYQTKEKQRTIELQESQLKTERLRLYFLLAGLVLALVAGAIFFVLSKRLRRRNAENEKLVGEKETLIGEIHHRVKNNLQVISSLLELQSRKLDDRGALDALRESQSRVQAMGLIHQKLYQGDEMTTLPMREYLYDLGETLLDAYQLDERVEILYDVEEIDLDADTAIPLGLIVNELVTNALKYAFPTGQEGTIELGLYRKEDGQLELSVQDDGVGQSAAPKLASSTSFGGGLVELLTQRIGGTIERTEGEGYGSRIRFPERSLATA